MKKYITILTLLFSLFSFSQSNYEEYSNIALSELMNGNLTNALTNINKAINIDTNKPNLYYIRGNIYQKQNLLDKALKDYLYTIKLKPEHIDAIMKTAITYGKLGNRTNSCIYLMKACNLGETKACQGYNKFCK